MHHGTKIFGLGDNLKSYVHIQQGPRGIGKFDLYVTDHEYNSTPKHHLPIILNTS